MKLTQVLFKQNRHRQFCKNWLRIGAVQNPDLVVPAYLKNRGIEVVDAKDYYRKKYNPSLPAWKPSVPDDPRFMVEPPPEEHPDYNQTPVLSFDETTKLLEGEKQSILLSKSQAFDGLPESIANAVGVMTLPNVDKVIQRYIMQANVWDPTKEKLKRRHTDLTHWKFKAEWGIPYAKRNSILLRNLMRLVQFVNGELPEFNDSRRVIEDHGYSSFYNFEGDNTIRIQGQSEFMVASRNPLGQFGDQDAIDGSAAHVIQDIYPIAPTIDLKRDHIYTLENSTGLVPSLSGYHPHTLILNDAEFMTSGQRDTRALLFCFGNCINTAKDKYGWDVKELPEPISVQCIYTNGELFSFMVFQLNTLDYQSSDGHKNFVWFDRDNLMYNKKIPKRAMLRSTEYEDYNPEVFDKMLAFYMNGSSSLASFSKDSARSKAAASS